MKNYFSFNQTGSKLLPVWLFIYFLVIIPYAYFIVQLRSFKFGMSPPMSAMHPLLILPAMLVIFVAIFLGHFFIIKFCIEGLGYRDKTLKFSGTPIGFLGTIVLGVFLFFITLGIYGAWFIRDITRFFINHTSYNSEDFEFLGNGTQLFVILLATLLIPLILLMTFMVKFLPLFLLITTSFFYRYIFQSIEILIIIPHLYFVYKWSVNVYIRQYVINWKTEAIPAILKVAQELILTMITFYIYFPLASVRLYKYFMDRTVAESPEQNLHFGYDIDAQGDFLYIWKEVLLCIVTLGIYFPWAFCNINKRILGKTFTQESLQQADI